MKILGNYTNGNYKVMLFEDGTKIRRNELDYFEPEFPESMDVKITNKCDMNCSFCHENSTVNGKHGDILNAKFIDTLKPFTEVANGGGDITSHPDLIPYLKKLKAKRVIANITVNQKHFEQKQSLIKNLIENDLIKGLGVSLVGATPEFIKLIKQYDNTVVHVINGIASEIDLEALSNNGLKVLILGYKELRRGKVHMQKEALAIKHKQKWLYDNLNKLKFEVMSFDNLALEQLDVKRLMSDDEWERFYMGDDGCYTMYVDLVERKFASSSTANTRYDLLDDATEMFKVVRTEDIK